MKIVRARSKYGAEKEYVSNKTKIRRIIREKKASESSEQGDIQFEYSLKKGICKVSSVDDLLKNNGLIVSGALENK